MTREILLRPAFDKTDPDPTKNCGIHGVELVFYLKGDLGVVQFVVYTNWHLPEVTERLLKRSSTPIGGDPHWMERPQGADIGYHSPKPMYDGQTGRDDCHLLPGGKCYYDGSSLQAHEVVLPILLREGSEGVWKYMENEYQERFVAAIEEQP